MFLEFIERSGRYGFLTRVPTRYWEGTRDLLKVHNFLKLNDPNRLVEQS